MKRLISWLMLMTFFCGVLAACDQNPETEGCSFYYLSSEADNGWTDTLFQAEQRQLDGSRPWKERIQLYLTGPVDDTLRNPFPRNVKVLSAILREEQHSMEILLSEEYAQLTGIGRTLANACLVWTLTEYAEVDQIILSCENGEELMGGSQSLSREMFRDSATRTEKEYTCRIYFTDESYRYLLPTTRVVVASENLPLYVIYQLLDGPTEDGLVATMPKSTRLLGFQLEDGVATVNLSEEFMENRPRGELQERMTLYSLVNSLTELDGIESVRILVEGQSLEYYQYFQMPRQFVRCETVIGPVSTGINEFDATLYYGSWSNEILAAEPTRIPRDDTRSPGEQIVRTLLAAEPVNGLYNLIPEGTQLLSADTIEGVCYIDLSAEFAEITGGYATERMAVHALVASLCSIDSIESVVLSIAGGTVTLSGFDLREPLSPQSNWFFPS